MGPFWDFLNMKSPERRLFGSMLQRIVVGAAQK